MGATNTWSRDQYIGPGGGLYTGPGGGLYTGPGGGMYAGPCKSPYRRNMPPWAVLIEYLDKHNMKQLANLIRSYLPIISQSELSP